MWIELDTGEYVEGGVFRWKQPYKHHDGIRKIQCELLEQKGELILSVSYKAEVRRCLLPGMVLGSYRGKIIEGHTFNVTLNAALPSKHLCGWGQRRRLRMQTMSAEEFKEAKGYAFAYGAVNVFWPN